MPKTKAGNNNQYFTTATVTIAPMVLSPILFYIFIHAGIILFAIYVKSMIPKLDQTGL